jgi:hypothetical protein
VRREYLKWNPVGSLYLRHGFVRTHEADIHFFLERPPRRAAKYRSARTNFSRSAALVQTFDLHIFLSGENLARPHSFCSLVMGVGDTTP